jgi:hypothetical protein
MQDFKDKLYNYEAKPPAEIWDNIITGLDETENKVLQIPVYRKKSKFIFYSVTIAASLLIIFFSSIIFNKTKNSNQNGLENITSQKIKDSLILNNKILEAIIKSSKDTSNVLALNYANSSSKVKKYLTIAGPEGQPVKISPKVATLIESADNEFPPKAVWKKKIEKWKQIMLSSTLSPTSTNLLDIVQITADNE